MSDLTIVGICAFVVVIGGFYAVLVALREIVRLLRRIEAVTWELLRSRNPFSPLIKTRRIGK